MSKITPKQITEDLRNNILDYWKTSPDNSVKNVAKAFEVSEGLVHSVLNKYLKSLKK